MCSLLAAVTNITLFLKRFPGVEDMALIVPGLEKPASLGGRGAAGGSGIEVTTRVEELESESGGHNPTIIL